MFKQFRDINVGDKFFVGCDTSYGANDYCVAMFYRKNTFDVPLLWRAKKICNDMTNELHPLLERLADKTGFMPVVAYERAQSGASEMERLAALNRLGKYTIFQMPQIGVSDPERTTRLGWDTNSATRPEMLSNLKSHIDEKLIKIYDEDTINELYSFVLVQTSSSVKAQAERNAHDDCVMSLAIALKIAQMSESKPMYRYTERQQFPAVKRMIQRSVNGSSRGYWPR